MPGSWIFWIGGIAARVGPKRLTDVKLTTKDKAGLKTAKEVAVQGAVTLRTGGQQLCVDVRGSDKSRGSMVVTTGQQGTFQALFLISQLDRPKEKQKLSARVRLKSKLTYSMRTNSRRHQPTSCASDKAGELSGRQRRKTRPSTDPSTPNQHRSTPTPAP